MIEEFRKRYKDGGISDLIDIRDYLEEWKEELQLKGRDEWNKARRMRKDIKGNEINNNTKRSILDNKISSAGNMYNKADAIHYRLVMLKKFIWSICVKGNVIESEEEISSKEEWGKWKKRKTIMIYINKEKGIGEYGDWISLSEDILAHEGSNNSPESIRKQIKRKFKGGHLRGNYQKGPVEIVEHVEEWAQDDELRREARKYQPPLSAVSSE